MSGVTLSVFELLNTLLKSAQVIPGVSIDQLPSLLLGSVLPVQKVIGAQTCIHPLPCVTPVLAVNIISFVPSLRLMKG
ncbi:hypothetical protein D9M68_923050 [compost metagenome]